MLFLKGKLCKLKRRLFFVIPVTCFIVSSVETISAGEKLLSAGQKSEIQDLIRQYILKNPDEILESIQKLHARKEREREERSQKNLIVMEPQLTKEPTSPVGGNLNGDVTIVEFFDYRCGY